MTGKNADASWVRIYYPLPDRTEAWVTSGPLQIAGSIDVDPGRALLAGRRGSRARGPAGRVADGDRGQQPVARAAVVGPSSPPPTPPPNGAPVLARLAAAPGTIAGGPQRYCANTARAVTVSVRVTDAQPIASVVLSYRRPGLSGYATKPMARGGGANTWQATLAHGHGRDRHRRRPPVLRERDRLGAEPANRPSAGERRRHDHGRGLRQQGADVRLGEGEPGDGVHEPRGLREQPAGDDVSAAATDVDGVNAMTLHYHLPGDPADHQAAMTKSGVVVEGHGVARTPPTRTPGARRPSP